MSQDDKTASERLRGRVEYWKQIVSIQMHFNDMCIRTRWLGLTAIATLLAAAGVAAKDNTRFRVPFDLICPLGLPGILMMVALVLLLALWFLDKRYYYKMLIASVEYGEKFELRLMQDLDFDDAGVTSFISSQMPRRRAAVVSSGFYFLTGAVILFFLVESLLR